MSKIQINDTGAILDIGCGGSQTLKTLSSMARHGKIYGIDYSEEAIAASAKENYNDVQTGKVTVIPSSVSSMPFTDCFFDIITAFQTHYFWPALNTDVKEVARILKAGGTFLLVSELYKIDYHMKRIIKHPTA